MLHGSKALGRSLRCTRTLLLCAGPSSRSSSSTAPRQRPSPDDREPSTSAPRRQESRPAPPAAASFPPRQYQQHAGHAGHAAPRQGPRPSHTDAPQPSTSSRALPRTAPISMRRHAEAGAQPQAPVPSTAPVALDPRDPTHVPRNPGVRDGPWSQVDAKVVRAASQEGQPSARQQGGEAQTAYDQGYVLLDKSVEELEALAVHFGQPAYRGRQLRDALIKGLEAVTKGARSVEEVSNIPKDFRAKLKAAGIRSGRSILQHFVASPDGTRKFLLQLHDGRVVECVGIPMEPGEDGEQRKRLTVCVSSQVGCPMRCTFCATGKGGFARNLLPHEIMDQVMTVQEEFGQRVSNVVFMGMGEPMLNLGNVSVACRLLNQVLGIGARFLTISTVGVPNTLAKLAKQDLKATLAVSIHAPNQELRQTIIPSAKAYPLDALMQDIQDFYKQTGRRVTFEYTLLAGVNDQDEHARELAKLLRSYDLESHVNVIPWNPVDESEYERPSRNRAYAFQRVLQAEGLTASLRLTRGLEAAAACGQLRNQHQKEPLPEFAVPS